MTLILNPYLQALKPLDEIQTELDVEPTQPRVILNEKGYAYLLVPFYCIDPDCPCHTMTMLVLRSKKRVAKATSEPAQAVDEKFEVSIRDIDPNPVFGFRIDMVEHEALDVELNSERSLAKSIRLKDAVELANSFVSDLDNEDWEAIVVQANQAKSVGQMQQSMLSSRTVDKVNYPLGKAAHAKALLQAYAFALVNLYGVVSKTKLLEIYNEQNKFPLKLKDTDFLEEENYLYEIVDDLLVHSVLLDEEDKLDELTDVQANKPYFIPPKKELLRFEDDGYHERPPAYLKLKDLIKRRFKLEDVEADDLVDDIQLALSELHFQLEDALFEFERRDITFTSEKQIREILPLLMDLSNHTRLWANRGYTPHELSNLERKETKILPFSKIGRNDPCPCGSGKKYKQCCGKTNQGDQT